MVKKHFLKTNIYYEISVMTTSTPEKQDGLKVLNDAIEKIKITINELGGVFNVQMAVRKNYVIRNFSDCFF